MSQSPFASPRSPAKAPPPAVRPYVSATRLATVIFGSLALGCSCLLVGSALDSYGVLMFPGFSDPNAPVTGGDAELVIIYAGVGVAFFGFVSNIVAIVATCMFVFRTNHNVRALGATGLTHSAGWSVGYWFIPIINLFRPYQAVKEIYRASHHPVGPKWQSMEISSPLAIWWTTWLLGQFAANIETRLVLQGVDMGQAGILLNWFSTIVIGISAVLFIMIVRRITERQEYWHRASGDSPGHTSQTQMPYQNR